MSKKPDQNYADLSENGDIIEKILSASTSMASAREKSFTGTQSPPCYAHIAGLGGELGWKLIERQKKRGGLYDLTR